MKIIFICISETLLKRQTLAEKLRLVRPLKTEYSEINWCGNTFYSANIGAYRQRDIEKFKRRCRYPVITPYDIQVKNFKYTVTANTVFKIFENRDINIALFDKNCNIIHLLPRLVSRCRSVYVYTEHLEHYEKENNRIFSAIGAAAVISDRPILPRGTTAVITDSNLSFGDIKVFGEYGYFVDGCTPIFNDGQMLTLPEYTDVYTALTGLYSVCKIKNTISAYCEELAFKNCKFSIKNLP